MKLKIFENKDKRAKICKIGYVFVSNVVINNYPGDAIQIVGDFNYIEFSTASFSEIQDINGEQYQQELIIEIKGSNEYTQSIIDIVTGNYCLIQLKLSNNETKIIGSPESPIMMSHEESGQPIINKLYVKRQSSEKSKYMIC